MHLAGSYLASPFARWHTFGDYRRALDSVDLPSALADLDDHAGDRRATIQRTWDLSLDAMAAGGKPEARPVLLMLSCYAPAAPIPLSLFQPQTLTDLAVTTSESGQDDGEGSRRIHACLRDLAIVGLVDITSSGDASAVTVHPVVADANRARLRTQDLSGLPRIAGAAVQQIQRAASRLDPEKPADWSAWLVLTPHILALLEWAAAELDTPAFAILLHVSTTAVNALLSSGDLLAAESLGRAAVTAGQRLASDHVANLAARDSLADALDRRGNSIESEQLYKELLADQQRVLGSDHPDTLGTRFELARVIGHTRFGQAEQLLREVLADQERILGSDDPHTVRTRHTLAWVLGRQGKGREAEQIFRQSLSQRRQIHGDDHPDTMSTRHGLAWAMTWQGRHREAEQQYKKVLEDQERILGSEHPGVLRSRHDLAWSIAHQGRNGEAEQLFRGVLPDMERVRGGGHRDTLYARLNLARTIAGQGRYREAEQMYRQLVDDELRAVGEEQPVVADTLYSLAQAVEMQGRNSEAEHLYQQALASARAVLGDNHPSTLQSGHMLALAMTKQGRYAEATQLLRNVLAAREEALGKDHPDTIATERDLEQAIKLKGQTTSQ